MKKSISLMLCLIMLFSTFSICSVAAGTANISDAVYVKASSFVDDLITYTVYLKKNISITSGAIFKFVYDPAVLEPVSGGAYKIKDSYGDEVDNVAGVYVNGKVVTGSDHAYSIAYTNINCPEKTVDRGFMTVTFKVVSADRPMTTVNVHCVEFGGKNTVTSNEISIGKNDVAPQMFYTHKTTTLNQIKFSGVASIDGGLRISWKPTFGATEYFVFKEISGKFVQIATVPATQTYADDLTATPNVVSRYTVRAQNENGVDSGYAGAITGVYTKAPDKFVAAIQPAGVKLTWTAVTGAKQYTVFRRTVNADGTRTAWGTVAAVTGTTTSVVDTKYLANGTHYEYTIRAFTANGASAVCRYADLYYYSAPVVTLASVSGGAKISWNAINGAEKYLVYRQYVGAVGWEVIATVDASTLSYLDTTAIHGKGINYTVRAFSSNGYSWFVGKRINYVQTPKLTGISNAETGIFVKWNAVAGASSYRIYRKVGNQAAWSYLANVKTPYYTDRNVRNGYAYRYTVIAVRNNVFSGFDANGLVISCVATPKLTKISNLTGGITVNWTPISLATSYNVYRKVGNSGWQYVGSVNTTSFTDKNVVKGYYYTYTVRAVTRYSISGFSAKGITVKR